MSQTALLALWRDYRATDDPKLRDRLVFSLAPVVKSIVYRKVREIPAHCDIDDLISCGLEAVLGCIDRYDPARGASLEQFAWTRIHGAVIDELRRYDWAPRSLRRMEREYRRACERFTVLHGRTPGRAELCDLLAISESELVALQDDMARCEIESLNALIRTDDDRACERVERVPSADRLLDPEHAAMRGGAIARLRAVVADLDPREREVVLMLHAGDMTLRQVGDTLGLSESRVCQIHRQLKRELRERLADHEALLLEVA